MTSNIQTFRSTIADAKRNAFAKLTVRLYNIGLELIKIAVANKSWTGFTGNAQTSFAIGIYKDGVLWMYETGEYFLKQPLMRKIKLHRRVYLKKPYEGPRRSVTGKVPVSDTTGPESSVAFLRGYKPTCKRGLALVMTIGVEYAEFLGSEGDLGPLTTAAKAAKKLIWQNIASVGANK